MEKVDLTEFRAALDDPGERAAAAYLRKNPRVLYWTFCSASGHDRFVFFEFPLGSQYVADAVILNSYSGAWEAFFIEFEPAGDATFTKAGTPTKRLAGAFRQVDDWRMYIEQNADSVRRDFVRWAGKYDRLGYSDGRSPSNYSGDRLADPRSVILYKYAVIIGRSSRTPQETRSLAGRHAKHHFVDVVSYDRFLRLAERRYGAEQRDSDVS